MRPPRPQPRSLPATIRLGLAVVLCLSLLGAALVVPVAGAGTGQWIAQDDPDRPDRDDEPAGDGGGEVPVQPQQEPEPPAQEPPAPPVADEPAPVDQPAPPVVAPTPEPWGPARLQLYGPAFEQTVPDGADATFTLEVAHLGAGGPDAKELWVDAPAGWGVRFDSAVAGESLFDADLDGRPETRPLYAGDWTYVAVTITTPGILDVTGWATVRVRATSAAADQDAFRDWIDLTVTATVPVPSVEPPVVEPPAPESPAVEPSPVLPEPSPVDPAPDPSDPGTAPEPTPSPDPSGDGQDGVSSSFPSPSSGVDEASPSASASASMWASASASASPSTSTSPSASPSASVDPLELEVVSVPDDAPDAARPGETVVVSQGFAVEGLPDEQTVRLAIRANVWAGWDVSLDAGAADGGGDRDGSALVVEVTGDETVAVDIAVDVPANAPGGDTTKLTITGEVIEILSTEDEQEGVAIGLADEYGPAAGAAYDLSVVSAATLSVDGDARFGRVNAFGEIDQSIIGDMTSTVDGSNAFYVREGAITLVVSGTTGSWEISCQVVAAQLSVGGPEQLQWRETGGSWQRFSDSGVCLRGTGEAEISLDLRLQVAWGGPVGPVELQLTFTLQQTSDGSPPRRLD